MGRAGPIGKRTAQHDGKVMGLNFLENTPQGTTRLGRARQSTLNVVKLSLSTTAWPNTRAHGLVPYFRVRFT